MKRIVPLILALLLLAACGAEPVETSPAPSEAAPAPLPEVKELTEYVPPLDFEPLSVWQAEPFGLDGEAVLYLGETRFKVFTYYANGHEAGLCESRAFSAEVSGGAFTAELGVNRGGSLPIPGVTALSGEIRREGGRLTLSYTGAETDAAEIDLAGGVVTRASGDGTQYLPLEFYELTGDEAALAMYSMPVCSDEMSWCPNSGDTAFLYEKDYCYLTDDPEYAPGLRGIELGDSFADIAARLPNGLGEGFDPRVLGPDAVELRQGEYELLLYGCSGGYSRAALVYLDGTPAYVTVLAIASSVDYFLDENLEICAIGYNLGGEDANIAWRGLSEAEASPVSAAPAAMPEAKEPPDYIPPMDFEPVSVWQAEHFCGRALLYLGTEEDGVTPLKVYSCFTYDVVDYLDGNMLMGARAFSAEAAGSGDFSVDCGKHGLWLEPVLGASALTGRLSVDGDRLTLSYTGCEHADWAEDTPGFEFSLGCGQPFIDSGTGENDSVQYLPTQFRRLPDKYLGRAMYWMPMFEEEASAGQIRGLGVGDTYADIVARFPNPLDIWSRDPRSVSAPDGWYDTFYGSEAGTVFAALFYEGGAPSTVIIACCSYASFRLDKGLNITDISISSR